MPTILRVGKYAVQIFTNDHPPAHVHIRKGSMLAKIELEPEIALLNYDKEFSPSELRKMIKIIEDNIEFLLEKWDEYHKETDHE